VPYNEVVLSLAEVLAAIKRDLCEGDLNSIEFECPEALPPVRGDLFQLWFCLITVLSYLLRFVPEERRIRVAVAARNGQLRTEIHGFLPKPAADQAASGERLAVAKVETDVALAREVIEKFIANHHGRFEMLRDSDAEVRFIMELPAVRDL